jgi:hypothetical protein
MYAKVMFNGLETIFYPFYLTFLCQAISVGDIDLVYYTF